MLLVGKHISCCVSALASPVKADVQWAAVIAQGVCVARVAAFASGLAVVVLNVACSSSRDNSSGKQITVGMLIQQSDTGDSQKEIGAGLLAMRQVNSAGGIRIDDTNYELAVLAEDHQGTAAGTVAAMQRLAEQGVTATIGPPWSSLALGQLPDHSDGATLAARRFNMLMISASATASAITDLPDDDLQWRTIPSDAAQAEIGAKEILSRGLLRAAVLYRDDSWGQGLAQAFQTFYKAGGGTITAVVKYEPEGASIPDLNVYDFNSELDSVFADKPDVVLLYNFNEVFQITNRIALGGYLDRYSTGHPLFFGSDANMSRDLTSNGAPEVIRYMEGTSPTSDQSNPYYQEFLDWLTRAQLDTADNTAAPRYDAINLLAAAMQKANSIEADDVKVQLQTVSRRGDGKQDVYAGQWAATRSALLAGKEVNYDGVSGGIEFSDKGDPTTGLYTIWKVVEAADGMFSLDLSKTVPYGD